MTDMTPPLTTTPAGFRPLTLEPNGFIEVNGPLYGKGEGDRFMLGIRVEPRHCNPRNACHGGMLMTLCDMQLALGSNYQGKLLRFLPTVNLNADFLAPAPLGSWVEGRTEVLRVTRNLVFAQAILTADGTPVLRGNGIFKLGSEIDPSFSVERFLGS